MLTITSNSGGGQPESLANIRSVREVCDRFGKPLFLGACRFAENAWFTKTREEGYARVPVVGIVRQIAALADRMTIGPQETGPRDRPAAPVARPDRTGSSRRRRDGRFANVTRVKTADNASRAALRRACARRPDALPVLRPAVRDVAARDRRRAAARQP